MSLPFYRDCFEKQFVALAADVRHVLSAHHFQGTADRAVSEDAAASLVVM